MTDRTSLQDPRKLHPAPPFPDQPQPMPGLARKMDPVPDHGEQSYRGSGRLAGRKALVTGGDSGIGRAAAIAFAREGADVAISYLPDETYGTRSFCPTCGSRVAFLYEDEVEIMVARWMTGRAGSWSNTSFGYHAGNIGFLP